MFVERATKTTAYVRLGLSDLHAIHAVLESASVVTASLVNLHFEVSAAIAAVRQSHIPDYTPSPSSPDLANKQC